MGDRTTCVLTFGGVITKTGAMELADIISDHYGYPEDEGSDDYSVEDITNLIMEGVNRFAFDEMNYARLPEELQSALASLALDYAWSNEAGGGYGAGILLHSALSEDEAEYATVEGELALPVSSMREDGSIDRVTAWQGFYDAITLQVAKSHHDEIGMLSPDHPMHAYAVKAFSAAAAQGVA